MLECCRQVTQPKLVVRNKRLVQKNKSNFVFNSDFIYICNMKSALVLLFLFSTDLFGQTNFKTILNTKKDSSQPIDLHLKNSERLSTSATILHASAAISTSILYFVNPNPKAFLIPASMCVGSITLHILSSKEFKKSKNYLDSEWYIITFVL